jgi:hypothetical protein
MGTPLTAVAMSRHGPDFAVTEALSLTADLTAVDLGQPEMTEWSLVSA